MDVHLKGALPRSLRPGENMTVTMNDYKRGRGYQVKTLPVAALGADEGHAAPRPGTLVVHGRQTYTTHHGPYELRFLESLPFAEVHETLGGSTHAVVAMGPQVNISPRYVWYADVKLGRLATYHGDGVMMKTYRNLTANDVAVRVVFDFERLTGYALFGRCEEVRPADQPDAWRETCAGFTSLGYANPSRLFRHHCERIEAVSG
jgi:hypothetical protein